MIVNKNEQHVAGRNDSMYYGYALISLVLGAGIAIALVLLAFYGEGVIWRMLIGVVLLYLGFQAGGVHTDEYYNGEER